MSADLPDPKTLASYLLASGLRLDRLNKEEGRRFK